MYDSGYFTAYKNAVMQGGLRQQLHIAGDSGYIASHAWGGPIPGTSTRMSGAIDEVRIYGRALTSQEIQALYVIGNPTSVDQGPADGLMNEEFLLHSNFPNPFNPSTTIGYSVKRTTELRLAVYNCLGQEVYSRPLGIQSPGNYRVPFDASGLPAGEYFCRLSSKSQVQTIRILLVK